jgi:hypothetical protein
LTLSGKCGILYLWYRRLTNGSSIFKPRTKRTQSDLSPTRGDVMFSTKPEVNDAHYGRSITFGNPDDHPIFTHHLCTQCHHPRITQARFEYLRNLQNTTNPNQRMLCHPCGEMLAKRETLRKQSRVLPINKSTPTYISDPEMLKQLNPKRTT